MFKPIAVLLTAAVLSGCASTTKWESSYKDYKDLDGAPKVEVQLTTDQIPGFMETSWHHVVEVYIDGNLALEAPIHEDYSGSLTFFYQDDRFEMECLKPHYWTFSECDVEINGRRAGKVAFGR
jgi:hypothetical protein